MNPYVILGQLVLTIGLVVGAWFYRGHVDAASCKADKETMQLAAQTEAAAIKSTAAKDFAGANLKNQGVIYDYQKRLKSLAAARADDADSLKRMRDAIGIYAAQPNPAGSAPTVSATGVSVCAADPRVIELGTLAGTLAIDGAEPAQDAAACSVKLRACESWASTVTQQFNASSLPSVRP